MTQHALLDRLDSELRETLELVRNRIARQPDEALRQRPHPQAWNAYECFAHLNAFSEAYTSRIELAIHKAKARKWLPAETLRYTGRGRRAIRRADPTNGKQHQTTKRFDFNHLPMGAEQVKSFSIQAERLLRLIQAAREVDLNRARVRKAHSWLGSYTLGNLLEFLVTHIRRHVAQASRLV